MSGWPTLDAFVNLDIDATGADREPVPPHTPPACRPMRYNQIAFRIDPRLLLGYHFAPITREEHEANEDRRRRQVLAWPLVDSALMGVPVMARYDGSDALLAVWDHHKPHGDAYPICQGCDSGSGASDYPEWPCTTAQLIAEQYDYALPSHHDLTRRKPEPDPEPDPEPTPEPTARERARALIHPHVARVRQYRGAQSPLSHEQIRTAMRRFKPGKPLTWKDNGQ